ncbi:MAG: hypothetical protein JWQ23_65 [Herminiimonas sp.]|jgi:hypothetical protein|nr:hypothetical protein [Herminiimonas sp.]
MAKLGDLAAVLRSKNAGPFQITIDLMFNDVATYERVRDSGALAKETLADLYQVEVDVVRVIPFDRVRAIKITLPRRFASHGSGSAFDRDVYGAQQHGPLVDIEI